MRLRADTKHIHEEMKWTAFDAVVVRVAKVRMLLFSASFILGRYLRQEDFATLFDWIRHIGG